MIWTETKGGIGFLDVAPLSYWPIVVATTDPVSLALYPPSPLVNGVPAPESWHTINLNSPIFGGIPSDVIGVDVNGNLAITMGTAQENVDIRVWFASPSKYTTNNSFAAQVECVPATQGERDNFAVPVKCEGAAFMWSWAFIRGDGMPVPFSAGWPAEASAEINMKVCKYYR